MPRYTYVALDSRGQESTGLVDASSTNEAIGQLRQAGYFPTSVSEAGPAGADGKQLFAYAHPIFWAPFSLVGDGGTSVVR